jgi:hypothetical protein
MNQRRRRLFSFLVDSAIRSDRGRMSRAERDERVRKLSFETDTSKLGVRMTGFLRDRLRRIWLRLRSAR